MKKIIIIGAGPSGMMAAISSKTHFPNAQVTILERNSLTGKKLALTGGGRCNVTVDLPNEEFLENIPRNSKFLYSSLANFNSKYIIAFFEKENCPLKKEASNKIYPVSNKSTSIINALNNKLKSLNIDIVYNTYVIDILVEQKILKTNKNDIKFDYLIIATGGKSYPQTGSDGTGYTLAKKLGHTVTDLFPVEVPLVSNDQVIQDKILQGLSFKNVNLSVYENEKLVKETFGELIFTHFGLSGPAALKSSYYIQNILKKGINTSISIDFLPNISIANTNNLSNEEIQTYLENNQIPKRLHTYLKQITTTKEELITLLKNFKLSIYTTRGFNNAFVTCGGISLKEINPKTLKSKLNNKVAFCGEILDVNGFTGGFNITIAFSTGYTAGKYILDENI
jgi:predicted Rossmann fold flavoprotein